MKKINNTLDKTILRVSLIFGFIIAISIVIYLQTHGKLLDTGSVNHNIDNKEQTVIKDLVENFGQSFKNVSLSSPNIKDELRQAYKDFVSPELLEQWQQNPSQAPGRIVSSP
jgi:ABC-type methionine transport system ATPase subunit